MSGFGLLSQALVARLQSVAEKLMPDTFAVLRTLMVKDQFGHESPDPAGPTVVASGNCQLRALAGFGAEAEVAGRLQLTKPASVDLPVGTDVRETDQLRVIATQRGVATTHVFEVANVERSGGYQAQIVAVVNEIS